MIVNVFVSAVRDIHNTFFTLFRVPLSKMSLCLSCEVFTFLLRGLYVSLTRSLRFSYEVLLDQTLDFYLVNRPKSYSTGLKRGRGRGVQGGGTSPLAGGVGTESPLKMHLRI